MNPSKRRFLAATAALGTATVAGCVGGGDGSDEPEETETDIEDVDPGLRLNGRALTSIFPAKFLDPGSESEVVKIHWHEEYAHWHAQPVEVRLGDSRSLRFVALDRDRERLPVGEDEPYQLAIRRGEETPADLVEVEVVGDLVTIHGTAAGAGGLFAQLRHDGEEVWLSPRLQVAVLE